MEQKIVEVVMNNGGDRRVVIILDRWALETCEVFNALCGTSKIRIWCIDGVWYRYD